MLHDDEHRASDPDAERPLGWRLSRLGHRQTLVGDASAAWWSTCRRASTRLCRLSL